MLILAIAITTTIIPLLISPFRASNTKMMVEGEGIKTASAAQREQQQKYYHHYL
jgi:hypothetical protein